MRTENLNKVLQVLKLNNDLLVKEIEKEINKNAIKVDEPCRFPIVSDFIERLYFKMRIDDDLIKETVKEFKQNLRKEYGKLLIASDSKTQFLVILIIYFFTTNDIKTGLRCNLLLLIKHYGNLMRKSLHKGCDETYFIQAKNYLSHKHLFVKYNGILNGLLELNKSMYKKYKNYLNARNYDPDMIVKFIYEGRHRVNQSTKSFVNAYMKAYQNKTQSVSDEDEFYQNKIKTDSKLKLAENISEIIINQKKIFDKSIQMANRITRLNKSIIKEIAIEITKLEQDTLKEVYIYLLDGVDNLNIIKNEVEFLKYTRRLMSVKVTKKEMYFKKIIQILFDDLRNNNNRLYQFYERSNNNTRYNTILSLALYLADSLHQQYFG